MTQLPGSVVRDIPTGGDQKNARGNKQNKTVETKKISLQGEKLISIRVLYFSKIIGDIYNNQKPHLSCPHEREMSYLHIPKLTLCQICMKPLLLLRS